MPAVFSLGELAGLELAGSLEGSGNVSFNTGVLAVGFNGLDTTFSGQLFGNGGFNQDGTGTLRPAFESYHERWAKILADVPGFQRVAWNQTWTDQKICRLQLFAYDRGFNQPRLVWQTDPPEDTIFQPLDIINDLDGDGVPEVCVAAHYRVMIFEGTTGRKKSELRYHQNRPYGWFGLADVDGDGQKEMITIGDFQSHIDVLNYDPQKPENQRLSVRWRRDIEQNIEERKKWPQVGPHPLADVTGDGKPEIVLNLFNDSGDEQWHVLVINAATGIELLDLPRQFVLGAADVDGGHAAPDRHGGGLHHPGHSV